MPNLNGIKYKQNTTQVINNFQNIRKIIYLDIVLSLIEYFF